MIIQISRLLLLFFVTLFSQIVTAAENIAKRGMVEAHNTVRAEVNLPPLKWSEKLEKQAKEWGTHLRKEGCFLEHSNLLDNEVGENLYMVSIPYFMEEKPETEDLEEMTAYDVVDAWASEKSHYQPKTNRCAKGQECGHYTQIVWAKSKEVGCAMTHCDTTGLNRIWVCNYSPAGNIIGEKPY